LVIRAKGAPVGILALLAPRSRRMAGIDGVQVACAAVDLGRLTAFRSRENRFEPLPELPETEFDLSVVVADDIPWSQVSATAHDAHELVSAVSYLDEYRGSWVPAEHRSLSLRVTLRPRDTTLTAAIIGAARDAVVDRLARDLDAHLR
jgi:phenylalanyl-tRNA synthetase beta chain